MRKMASRVFLCVFIAASNIYGQSGETQHEQVNRLLEEVHNRVNEAAVAAEYALNADRHLRRAERLAAAGQIAEARAELDSVTQVIAAADRLGIQEDFLLQDYAWKAKYALNTLRGTKESPAKDVLSRGLGTPDFLPVIQDTLIENGLPPQ